MSQCVSAVVGVLLDVADRPMVLTMRGIDPHIEIPGRSECPLPVAQWLWGRPSRGCAYLAWHVLAWLASADLATLVWEEYAGIVVSRLHRNAFVITREQVERFVAAVAAGLNGDHMVRAASHPEDN